MGDDDLNQSYQRLQSFDIDEQEAVEGCVTQWFAEVKKKLNCEYEHDLKADKFNTVNKPVLTRWLATVQDLLSRQREVVCNKQEVIELLKTEALADKEKVIRLQSDMLVSKEEQLKSLQTTVQTTVQSAVNSGIKSYSAAVSSNSGTACSKEEMKSVIKSVVTEEDRSRNLISCTESRKTKERSCRR